MTTLAVGEPRQADWTERDDHGEVIICVTNSLNLDLCSVRLLGGGQDRPQQTNCDRVERPRWWAPVRVSVTFSGPQRPEIEAFENERAGFYSQLSTLRRSHNEQYVAIHGGAVVDSDARREALVRRFFARFGDAPVYIGYVGEPPIGYQVTPFRI